MEEENKIEIMDYMQGAFMHAHGIPFEAKPTPGVDGRVTVKFIFENSAITRIAIDAFYNDGQIGIQSYLTSLEEIKTSMMSIVRAARRRRVPENMIDNAS